MRRCRLLRAKASKGAAYRCTPGAAPPEAARTPRSTTAVERWLYTTGEWFCWFLAKCRGRPQAGGAGGLRSALSALWCSLRLRQSPDSRGGAADSQALPRRWRVGWPRYSSSRGSSRADFFTRTICRVFTPRYGAVRRTISGEARRFPYTTQTLYQPSRSLRSGPSSEVASV